jgi:hypothetical protein
VDTEPLVLIRVSTNVVECSSYELEADVSIGECVNMDVSVELNMLFIADVSISVETIVLV